MTHSYRKTQCLRGRSPTNSSYVRLPESKQIVDTPSYGNFTWKKQQWWTMTFWIGFNRQIKRIPCFWAATLQVSWKRPQPSLGDGWDDWKHPRCGVGNCTCHQLLDALTTWIPLHRPYIGLIYGRYLHFRILKFLLIIEGSSICRQFRHRRRHPLHRPTTGPTRSTPVHTPGSSSTWSSGTKEKYWTPTRDIFWWRLINATPFDPPKKTKGTTHDEKMCVYIYICISYTLITE